MIQINESEQNSFSSSENNDGQSSPSFVSSQLSGRVASQFKAECFIETNDENSKIKRKSKKKSNRISRRLSFLKKKLHSYLKRKEKRRLEKEISSENNQFLKTNTMIDLQLSPDLSKRKYIYKDVTINNTTQINLVTKFIMGNSQNSLHEKFFRKI